MKRKYTILRVQESTATSDPFRFAFGRIRAAGDADELPAVSIDADELDARGVDLLGKDRNVLGLAQFMPTKLIEPVGSAQATDVWGIAAVGADTCPFDGRGVKVCVLDTGIDAQHDAFQGVELEQRDFTNEGQDDLVGHGTHCAGTIFGRDVGGTRIGIARGITQAMVGKVLGSQGGDTEMLIRGLQWAIDGGARVISMSLGYDFPGLVASESEHMPVAVATSRALEAYRANLHLLDALMAFADARVKLDGGTIVVAASGNESRRPDIEINVAIPAAAKHVVAVGAAERVASNQHRVAAFSNSLPTLAAPGVGVLSARVGGGLTAKNGTSMATPHVAGVAALWWQALAERSRFPTAPAVLSKLLASARPEAFENESGETERGAGMVTCPIG